MHFFELTVTLSSAQIDVMRELPKEDFDEGDNRSHFFRLLRNANIGDYTNQSEPKPHDAFK